MVARARLPMLFIVLLFSVTAQAGWKPTLQEEFRSALDPSIWSPVLDVYGSQHLNNEQECYIPSALGVANDLLTITAQRQTTTCTNPSATYPYSSGAIASFQKDSATPAKPGFYQTYGYFEMRAKLSPGVGTWPAFWLLPNPQGWPPEIDIMEMFGNPRQIQSTLHWQDPTFGHVSVGKVIPTTDLSAAYHTYGVDWQHDKLIYYFDGVEVFRITGSFVPSAPMYVLANLAIGDQSGDPTNTTFPQSMSIDYIHVYSRDPSVPGDDTLPPNGSAPANVPTIPFEARAVDFGTTAVYMSGQQQGFYADGYSGNAWSLSGPGFIEQLINFPTATTYRFTVEAASKTGAPITFSVDVDGSSVTTASVSSTALQEFVLNAAVPAGLHNVAIRMQNPSSGSVLNLGAVTVRDPNASTPPPSGTPTVSITTPTNGQSLNLSPPNDWTTFTATASGGTGIDRVQFFLDNDIYCTVFGASSPYNCAYHGTISGTHTLKARAIDRSGTAADSQTVSFTVNSGSSSNVSVTIWAPQANQSFDPNFWTTFTAVASSNNSISGFAFYVDNVLIPGCSNVTGSPANCSYQTPASGTHTLRVVASDSSGATGEATQTFSINGSSSNVSVTIWAPTPGQTFSPNYWTTFTAVASGNNPISKFDFYVDGSLAPGCGNVTGSPANCSYLTPSSGTHTLQVTATDSTGATGSASVGFSVQ